MIKLDLLEKPKELTEEKERELVEIYRSTERDVWQQSYIKKALLKMSNNKCAYSEQKLNTESAYMEVEHFRHKKKYKDLVVRWGNLLPACKKCNVSKGEWDVVTDPIVNPLEDIPANHLFVKSFRFYNRDEKGQNTIEAVALNDREHFVNSRSAIGFKIADTLEDIYELAKQADSDRKKKRVVNRLKVVLSDCGPKHEYSAVLATYVLYEVVTYRNLKAFLKENSLWDSELDDLENVLEMIAMPETKHKDNVEG